MPDAAMTEDADSLITPAMRAAIGREGASITRTIEAEPVLRLIIAYDEDPAIIAAVRRGDRSVALPPYCLSTITSGEGQIQVPDLPPHQLLAADGWSISAPIHLGDRLTITPRLADIQERIGGRVGHSLFVHNEWVCVNADREEVARMLRTMTYFPQGWAE